jgi:hypothetical protein
LLPKAQTGQVHPGRVLEVTGTRTTQVETASEDEARKLIAADETEAVPANQSEP